MSQPPTPERERARRPRRDFAILLIGSLAVYLLMLGFGVVVVGDTVGRSSLMAGIIVVLSGMAYLSTTKSSRRRDEN